MKKNIILYALGAIIIGIILGKYIYNGYEMESRDVFNETTNKIYLIQYGVYSSEELMLDNTKKLKNYFYYIDNSKYHVLIGITSNKNLKDKIVNAYNIDNKVYLKEITTNNSIFNEALKQYDNLVNDSNDNDIIITAEKQILSKYEELILNSE